MPSSEGTGCETHGYLAMQRAWDIELIFPIKDAASAAVMAIKADCLQQRWRYQRRGEAVGPF
jgi:hypothetical protein